MIDNKQSESGRLQNPDRGRVLVIGESIARITMKQGCATIDRG